MEKLATQQTRYFTDLYINNLSLYTSVVGFCGYLNSRLDSKVTIPPSPIG